MTSVQRCDWCTNDPLYIDYHDNEWGVPVFDDAVLFEFIILESMQAGLNWLTILKKRENFRKAFCNFSAEKVARFSQQQINHLLQNPGIIRNQKKIEAAVNNAKMFLALQDQFGTFSDYLWQFTHGKPIQNHWRTIQSLPPSTPLSEKIAKDLKQHGFQFFGPTTCYAYLQAVGVIDDHLTTCFKRKY